jgi:hypothetical protein
MGERQCNCLGFLVVATALELVLGCTSSSPSVSADGGSGGGDGNVIVGGDGGVPTNACDVAFDVMTGIACGNASLPQGELDRIRPRWQRACTALLALPGTSWSASSFAACFQALQTQDGCDTEPDTLPDPCAAQPGTLGGGAACRDVRQCQSVACDYPTIFTDGGFTVPLCGQCLAPAQLGQPCSGQCNVDPCAAGTACAGGTCVAMANGDVGAPCGATCAQYCAPGLVCGGPSSPQGPASCVQPGTQGMPCPCVEGLTCDQASSKCVPRSQLGAACAYSRDCVVGLTCSPAHVCSTITWASAGQPCDGWMVRCLVGGCPTGSADAGGALCPAVIPDGQPCSNNDRSSTCDTYAECARGVCTTEYAATCM